MTMVTEVMNAIFAALGDNEEKISFHSFLEACFDSPSRRDTCDIL
jgi:hypothetical protein